MLLLLDGAAWEEALRLVGELQKPSQREALAEQECRGAGSEESPVSELVNEVVVQVPSLRISSVL